MKKQDLKLILKNRGVYITLLLGVLIVMVALSINKSQNNNIENENLVDLNEAPNQLSESNNTQSIINNQQTDNNTGIGLAGNYIDDDMLLEYDNQGGVLNNINPSIIGNGDSTSNQQQAENIVEENPSKPVDTASVITPPADTKVTEVPQEEPKKENNGEKEVVDTKNNEEEEISVSLVTVAELNFKPDNGIAWPVKGNVILNYSADHAIYHATLMQFKTNPAILIGCELGTEVKAATQGIVTDIKNTPQTGTTVTMAIGDDYFLVYGQLSDVTCEIGDVIEQGEIFANVSSVTKYYSVEGVHLYFQVLQGEATTNPMLLLKDE